MVSRPLLIAQLDAMHQSRGGDWYYRTFAPSRALAQLPDVFVVNLDQAHRKLPLVLEQADVLVVNGLCSADLLPVMQARKQARRITVFEINDDVQAVPASNPPRGFLRFFTRRTAVEMLEQTGYRVADVRINPDARLARTFEGKDLTRLTRVELDGLTLDGLSHQDVLELLALQVYLSATVA